MKLGADRRGFLPKLILTSVKRVEKRGGAFVAECRRIMPPFGLKNWEGVTMDNLRRKGAQSLLPPSIADNYDREWKVSLDECDPPLPDTVLRKLLAMYGRGGL